jgi:hypothetical protein
MFNYIRQNIQTINTIKKTDYCLIFAKTLHYETLKYSLTTSVALALPFALEISIPHPSLL